MKNHMRTMTPLEEQLLEERHDDFVRRYMIKQREKTTAILREAAKNGTLRQRMPPRPDGPDSNRPQSPADNQGHS